MKKCYRCQCIKPLEMFGLDRSRADGKQPKCKACVKEVSDAYRAANPEKRKAVCAEYRARNPEKVRAAYQAWYASDPEHARATKRAYDAENNEQARARRAKWRSENRAAIAGTKASRTAAEGHHTGEQIRALAVKQKYKCACCRADLRTGYHKDHIVPLKAGGTNDILNIQLLCKPCNLSKGAKHPIDFMQQRGFLL